MDLIYNIHASKKLEMKTMSKQTLCVICCASFSTKWNLKHHEDSIHKNIKFGCRDCGKQFKKKGDLKIHINNVHKGIRYKCDQCD